MVHLLDRHVVQHANAVLMLSLLWAGFAACAIGAIIYDIFYLIW